MTTSDNVMKISGVGSVAGGVYKKVTVSGGGRVTSALECDTLHVSGSVICEGPVKADDIRVSGSAEFRSDVTVRNAVVSGLATFRENLAVEQLRVSGAANVEQRVSGGTIHLQGGLDVGGDCEVEVFKATGMFTIAGLLSADTIDVRMHGACKAGEIGGESIEFRQVRRPALGIAVVLGIAETNGLEAGSVEGDHVLLERAKVGTVRGRDVRLGDGCDVDLVEYTAELSQARGARAKTVRKTEITPEP